LENEELDSELDLGLASLDEIREIKKMLKAVKTNFRNLVGPKPKEEIEKLGAKQQDKEFEVEKIEVLRDYFKLIRTWKSTNQSSRVRIFYVLVYLCNKEDED